MTEKIPAPSIATDVIRWVDTDIMVCDPLTKRMEGAKLTNVIDSNYWDLRQPHEALMKKRAKQAQRRSAKTGHVKAKPAAGEADPVHTVRTDADPADAGGNSDADGETEPVHTQA